MRKECIMGRKQRDDFLSCTSSLFRVVRCYFSGLDLARRGGVDLLTYKVSIAYPSMQCVTRLWHLPHCMYILQNQKLYSQRTHKPSTTFGIMLSVLTQMKVFLSPSTQARKMREMGYVQQCEAQVPIGFVISIHFKQVPD